MSEKKIKMSSDTNISNNFKRSSTEKQRKYFQNRSYTIGPRTIKLNKMQNSLANNSENQLYKSEKPIYFDKDYKESRKSIESLQQINKSTNVQPSQHTQHENQLAIWKRVDDLIKRIKFKKYIRQFLSLSRLRLYRLLTPLQLIQINDLSSWSQSTENQDSFLVVKEDLKSNNLSYNSILYYLNTISIPIFLPHSYLINIWQLLKVISLIFCYFCYLISCTYDEDIGVLFPYKLLCFFQICLIIDVFVIMNTGIYIKGILCTDRRQLFDYYKLSKSFYYDIISILCTTIYYLIHINQDIHQKTTLVLLLPIIFKLNDFQVIIKKVKQKFLLDSKIQNVVELINLVNNILLIAHIFACIWVRIGLLSQKVYNNIDQNDANSYSQKIESNTPHSWIQLMNLEEESWFIQYLNAYYFIIITMSTVGYGDIRPTNPIEVSICIILVLICSVMFGFTLNQIGEIFQDFFTQEKLIQKKRYIIANYMDKNHINPSTRKSIFEYLEYYWKESMDENLLEENKIINQLSDNLKEDLLIQSNKLILKESKVLKENFSNELLAKCVPIISEIRLTPGELIIDQRIGNGDCSIYFVLFGELEVSHNCTNKRNKQESNSAGFITNLKRGDSFGEKSFFTGDKKSLNIRSNSFSKILKIRRDDFIMLLNNDKEQYEKFCSLNDRIKFSSDSSYLQVQCKSCLSNMHEIEFCPSVHYLPKKMKILEMNNKGEPQLQRNSNFSRNRTKNTCTLDKLFSNSQTFLDFFENYYEDLLIYEEEYLSCGYFRQNKQVNMQSECETDIQFVRSLQEGGKQKQHTQDQFDSPKMKQYGKKINENKQAQTNPPINFSQIDEQVKENLLKDNFLATYKVQFSDMDCDNKNLQSTEQNNQQEFLYSSINLNINGENKGVNNVERIVQHLKQEKLKKQHSRDSNNKQQDKPQPHKQSKMEYFQKTISKTKMMDIQINNSEKSENQCRNEKNEFDIFIAQFENMQEYKYYFPKYNYKNVLQQLQYKKSTNEGKVRYGVNFSNQIKECTLYRKMTRNIQQILKEREISSCKSLFKSRVKLESDNNSDKGIQISSNKISSLNKEQNFESRIQSLSKFPSLNIQLGQSSHYDSNASHFQIEQSEHTPPRNEYQIHQIEQSQLKLNITSNYNFGSYCISNHEITDSDKQI